MILLLAIWKGGKWAVLIACLLMVGCSQKQTYRISDAGQTTTVEAYSYRIEPLIEAHRIGDYGAGWFSSTDIVVFECDLPLGSDVRYYRLGSQWRIQQLNGDSL